MKLEGWYVDRYKSLRECQFEPKSFNVIVGKNNSGKSNLINSLLDYRNILKNAPTNKWYSETVTGQKGGLIRFEAAFSINENEKQEMIDNYDENINVDIDEDELLDRAFEQLTHHIVIKRRGIHEESLHTPGINPPLVNFDSSTDSYHLLDLSDIENSSYISMSPSGSKLGPFSKTMIKSMNSWNTTGAFRKPESTRPIKINSVLDESGLNLVEVLETLSRRDVSKFRRIVDTYVDVMEGVEEIRMDFAGDENEPDSTVVVSEKAFDNEFPLDVLSAGSKEILILITQIINSADSCDLLFLEEPELHLHPEAEKRIFELLMDISKADTPQIILSTHSDVFLNYSKVDRITKIERDGLSTFHNVDKSETNKLIESLGYENSDIYQSDAIIFVEGRSDQSILSELSATTGESFDQLGITLHVLGGDRILRHGDELSNLLERLGIPYLFVVDSDDQDSSDKYDGLTDKINTNQVHVLDRYCIESYLLMVPDAISSAFEFDNEEVKTYIEDNGERPNGKSVIKDLFKNFTDKQKSYDEEEHGWTIARKISEEEVPEDLAELLTKIRGLAGE